MPVFWKQELVNKRKPLAFYIFFCICIYMLWAVLFESKDEAYLMVQVSLYKRSDNNYKTRPNLCNLYLNTGVVFQMERKRIRRGKSLNGCVKAPFLPLPEFPNTGIVQWYFKPHLIEAWVCRCSSYITYMWDKCFPFVKRLLRTVDSEMISWSLKFVLSSTQLSEELCKGYCQHCGVGRKEWLRLEGRTT